MGWSACSTCCTSPRFSCGAICASSPNTCQPVDYSAFPAQPFTDQGAANVEKAIAALPADEPVVLFGHSQGGQVIYSDLRRWAADPGNAPDPARVSWVSIGNPENRYGGKRPVTDEETNPWLPADTAYHGTEVIRQYDGWADWPDDPTNLIAVANAVVGMLTTHTAYWNVDLNDPRNVRYTPDLPGGGPGNVTYVWVPNDTLPLVAWAGPFAPMLDNALRPLVEKGYSRPVDIPDPTPPAAASARGARPRPPRQRPLARRPRPSRPPPARIGPLGIRIRPKDPGRRGGTVRTPRRPSSVTALYSGAAPRRCSKISDVWVPATSASALRFSTTKARRSSVSRAATWMMKSSAPARK